MKLVCLTTLFIAFSLFSCKKYADDAFDYYKMPHTLYFILTDSTGSNNINKTNKSQVKIFYYKESIKTYIPDFNVADSLSKNGFMCCTRDIALISANGIKEFYLEFNESKLDTIFIDVINEKNKDCM
ncbi:MAG: hypothetical protein ACXWEY_07390 [Bacteroidia bacterium]